MSARKTRLVGAPSATATQLGPHSTMRFIAGSMGAAPIVGQEAPLSTGPAERFEASHDDAAYQALVRQREVAEGLPAETIQIPEEAWVPAPEGAYAYEQKTMPAPEQRGGRFIDFSHGGTRDPGLAVLARSNVDLSPLPDSFVLEVVRKADGWWKVTAPGVHVGLFIANQDLPYALADAPAALAEIVRLDGVVARPKERRRAAK